MSVKSNSSKHKSDNVDVNIENVLAEIADIDEKIQKLSRRRQTLVSQYDELKDSKILQQCEVALNEEDWEKGTEIKN